MRSTMMIKTAKISYMVLSAVFCAMGIVLLTRPDCDMQVIGRVTGAALAAFGAVKLLGFYSKDLYRLAFQHDHVLGILSIALGLMLLLRRGMNAGVLCLVLGVEIVTDGLFKVQTALDARRFGLNTWWLMLALAAIAAAIGAWLVVCDGGRTLVLLSGVSLLAQGLLNLCVALCAIRITPNRQPNAA